LERGRNGLSKENIFKGSNFYTCGPVAIIAPKFFLKIVSDTPCKGEYGLSTNRLSLIKNSGSSVVIFIPKSNGTNFDSVVKLLMMSSVMVETETVHHEG
jgi:hypothetical protein